MLIGLTGGIATGKSTATKLFEQHGIPVVDADVVSRQMVEKGSEGLRKIVNHFGKTILNEDGTLNRKKLGELIFNDSSLRQQLNHILHPLIREEMNRQTTHLLKTNQHVIQDIPLLFENKLEQHFDLVIVVYIDQQEQIKRLQQRDDISYEAALSKVKSQAPIEDKKALADIVLNNHGTIDALEEQVNETIQNHF